jgi:erythromycin esterase-like protein
MTDTLDALSVHLSRQRGRQARIVVWAHNSHLGDARYTEMAQRGELNLGQLARERYGREACNVGFSTYTGAVTAASDWDGPAQTQRVRAGLPGSFEDVFHALDMPRLILDCNAPEVPGDLRDVRLQRAIGVIYRPETERQSHYFHAHLVRQFDAMIHFDETRALQPLEPYSEHAEEPPETYPTGI